MAKNKITFEERYDSVRSRTEYILTGSQRQPTIVEANNYLIENHIEVIEYFGVTLINFASEEWVPPDECKSLVFYGYDGGECTCPICGHERDLYKDTCPTCGKPW